MNFSEQTILGRTGIKVGRLGISSSYGAPVEAFEEAFERGCNYFTWGTFIKGRSDKMKTAIKNIIAQGKRDQLVLAMFTYAHSALLSNFFIPRGLRSLGTDYVDVLLLGYYSSRPRQSVLDGALKLKERGLVRHIGLSTHNRKLVPELMKEGIIDVFHIRYNPVHRGAEKDIFPFIPEKDRPGIVNFTSTNWGSLLDAKKMPKGEAPLSAADCYRFALSNPAVDICMTGTKNIEQMRENLKALEMGKLTDKEIERMVRIGNHQYKK